MKILLIIILILTLSQTFGQGGQLIIGKGYSAGQDSTSNKVYISIQNDLDFVIKGIVLTHDKQSILIIKKLKSEKRKCYSFLKKELTGDNVFILQYGTLTDTLRRTDEVSYNIHELEISGHQKPPTKKQKGKLKKLENRNSRRDDLIIEQRKCNYRQHQL